ncbi:MAG TPA: hypothetical protein VH196_05945, partial [Terriglobales bacterium]|nr:hypothetical protein [Terriglobales bacterium]
MKRPFVALATLLLWFSGALAQNSASQPPQSVDPELEKLIPQLESAHRALNDWPNLGRYRSA